mmetsp:Transcript_7635/g.16228  ORF Transcript_7635/g.16228 Transcript_7635/m.16228 type:complete len:325 (-) Transcript_7635:935-1909(-)
MCDAWTTSRHVGQLSPGSFPLDIDSGGGCGVGDDIFLCRSRSSRSLCLPNLLLDPGGHLPSPAAAAADPPPLLDSSHPCSRRTSSAATSSTRAPPAAWGAVCSRACSCACCPPLTPPIAPPPPLNRFPDSLPCLLIRARCRIDASDILREEEDVAMEAEEAGEGLFPSSSGPFRVADSALDSALSALSSDSFFWISSKGGGGGDIGTIGPARSIHSSDFPFFCTSLWATASVPSDSAALVPFSSLSLSQRRSEVATDRTVSLRAEALSDSCAVWAWWARTISPLFMPFSRSALSLSRSGGFFILSPGGSATACVADATSDPASD